MNRALENAVYSGVLDVEEFMEYMLIRCSFQLILYVAKFHKSIFLSSE